MKLGRATRVVLALSASSLALGAWGATRGTAARAASVGTAGVGAAGVGAAGVGTSHAGTSRAEKPAARVASAGWEESRDGTLCRHPAVVADCRDGMCRIPAGCFIKGSPDTEWGHTAVTEQQTVVRLTHSFEIQEHELTQAEWARLVARNPSGHRPEGGGDCTDATCPVGNVTWVEAAQFTNLRSAAHDPPLPSCYRLDRCTGTVGDGMKCEAASSTAPTLYDCPGYRLPTDAEFEYAARAGTKTAFYSGSVTPQADYTTCHIEPNLDGVAWYCHNSGGFTHPVGRLAPNGFGLHDVLGNALEWVNDPHTGNAPPPGPLSNPGGTLSTSPSRIMRGGGTLWPLLLRSASASLSLGMNQRVAGTGFRMVRSLDAKR